jgi:hypothetical protein
MMSKFHWINNFLALIVPNCAKRLRIFWMRQYCVNNEPASLLDLPRSTGCSDGRSSYRIIAPVLTPCLRGAPYHALRQFLERFPSSPCSSCATRSSTRFRSC